LVAAARLYEKVAGTPRLKAEQLERLAEDKAFDIAAARNDLGYEPRPFSQGIKEEVALLA
jgi:nucleoside-diphosphate-sugar epimerase